MLACDLLSYKSVSSFFPYLPSVVETDSFFNRFCRRNDPPLLNFVCCDLKLVQSSGSQNRGEFVLN